MITCRSVAASPHPAAHSHPIALDIETPYKSLGSGSTCPNYSPHGPRHKFKTFTGHSKHKCAYCGAGCYTYCATCSGEDPPRHAFCSFVTGRDCQDNHRRGVQPKFTMRIHKPKEATTEGASSGDTTRTAGTKAKRKRSGFVPAAEATRASSRANFGSPRPR